MVLVQEVGARGLLPQEVGVVITVVVEVVTAWGVVDGVAGWQGR